MTASLGNFQNGAFGSNLDGTVYPQFINAMRAPTSNDIFPAGTRWQDNSVNPPFIYETSGAGNWDVGGVEPATTTTFGTVQLATLSELQNGNAPAGAIVPLSNDVATVIAGVVAGAGVPATTAQQGYVFLSTDSNAVSDTYPNPNTALQPSNLVAVFAAPPAGGFGSTTPRPVAATTLSTTSSATIGTTLGVTGTTTLAALTQIGTSNINASGAATTNIGTGGTGALNIGNATGNTALTGALTVSTTLGVTGASTLAALSATSGTFSTTLGVTGASTFTSGTFSTTLGVTGLASLTTLAVSSTSTFTGLATFNGGTTIGSGTLTTGALTVVGTALINNSGSAATTIGGASAGAIGIVVGSGGNFSMTTATAAATMSFGSASQTGSMTFGASTAGQTINISSEATIAGANVVNVLAGATPGASQTLNIMTGVGTAGTYTFNLLTGNSTGTTQAVNIATGSALSTISIGGTGANVVAIANTQTGGSLSLAHAMTTGNIVIGDAQTSGTLTIGSTGAGTGAVRIVDGTGAQTVAISTGAGVKTVTLGSTNTTSTTTIQAGSGGVNLTGNVNLTSVATKISYNGGAATDFVGSSVLTLGTVTIANTNIAATDRIFLSRTAANASTTLGEFSYTISAGASFTVTSLIVGTPGSPQVGDLSSFVYFIVGQT